MPVLEPATVAVCWLNVVQGGNDVLWENMSQTASGQEV